MDEFFYGRYSGRLTWIKPAIVGGQNLFGVLFEVVELAGMQRPSEYREDREHKHGGERDQEIEDVHGLASRNEFNTTTSELVAIPSPAAQGGSKPASASGTQAAL